MGKLLIISTHGSEDPTRASMAWFFARGAIETGHQPTIVLSGDAAVLARRTVAEAVSDRVITL
jgi:predicted peroxiredoxin